MKTMIKKNFAILLSITFLLVLVMAMSLLVGATASSDVVYVSTSGNNGNIGTESAPVATITKALEKVKDGGTIHVSGTHDVSAWTAPTKNVTITGGTLDFGERRHSVGNTRHMFNLRKY